METLYVYCDDCDWQSNDADTQYCPECASPVSEYTTEDHKQKAVEWAVDEAKMGDE